MNAPAKPTLSLDPRPLYGIGTIARLTGLKPDTLRVWERRYGLGASHKSASGRRQYTQSDLEHLQLVAALVQDGARIGEIAKADGRTLQMLLERRSGGRRPVAPPSKPRVVFVGEPLCQWLDEHQGCISGVSALLARSSLQEALDRLTVEGEVAMLVVYCPSLSTPQIEAIAALQQRLHAVSTLVVFRLGNQQWQRELELRGWRSLAFPTEPSRLAFELGNLATERDVAEGAVNLGDLIAPKPRRYSDRQLHAAAKLQSSLTCECPRHLSDLVRALNDFEEYCTACSVENWQEAAVHACIYTYANQARHLLEKALAASLEGHEDEWLEQQRSEYS